MRNEIQHLVLKGPFLSDKDASDEQIAEWESILDKITAPVTDEEARALASLFGPDDLFGLSWAVLHLIESAPGWPLQDVLTGKYTQASAAEWIERLNRRAQNRSP